MPQSFLRQTVFVRLSLRISSCAALRLLPLACDVIVEFWDCSRSFVVWWFLPPVRACAHLNFMILVLLPNLFASENGKKSLIALVSPLCSWFLPMLNLKWSRRFSDFWMVALWFFADKLMLSFSGVVGVSIIEAFSL